MASHAHNILLIDDSADERYLFNLALKQIAPNVQFTGVPGADEGITFLKNKVNTPPDYVFVDLNMPKVNGLECLAKIKAIEQLEKVPVIMYTTVRFPKELKYLSKMGARYILHKSSLGELKVVLDALVKGTPDSPNAQKLLHKL